MTTHTQSSPTQDRQVLLVAIAVTALVAYKLFEVASQTGNYEGMWFSLLHTLIVAAGTVVALRRV
jgi:hypothetical protein